MFDTGEPHSGRELAEALGRLVAEGASLVARWPDTAFFARQGSYWSPAEHIRHLRKSSSPLVLALGLPRIVLGLRFGRHHGPSRSFNEMRRVYLGALSAGGLAGRFTPSPEPVPGDPAARRLEIMNAWTGITVSLGNAIARWDEPALDRYRLPHPLLGKLTVREMLHFTVYHTAHHLSRVAERAGAGARP